MVPVMTAAEGSIMGRYPADTVPIMVDNRQGGAPTAGRVRASRAQVNTMDWGDNYRLV
jgi:hypothetical protein